MHPHVCEIRLVLLCWYLWVSDWVCAPWLVKCVCVWLECVCESWSRWWRVEWSRGSWEASLQTQIEGLSFIISLHCQRHCCLTHRGHNHIPDRRTPWPPPALLHMHTHTQFPPWRVTTIYFQICWYLRLISTFLLDISHKPDSSAHLRHDEVYSQNSEHIS